MYKRYLLIDLVITKGMILILKLPVKDGEIENLIGCKCINRRIADSNLMYHILFTRFQFNK